MGVCNSALEHLANKVKEEERIIIKIPDDQDIAIPSEYPSGYPTQLQSPNKAWSRDMVEEYEHERCIRKPETAAGQRNLPMMWLQS